MANFTPEQYVKELDKRLKKIERERNRYIEITFAVVAMADKRIFDEGKSSTGAAIGSYKGGEMYVNTSKVGRKKVAARGKFSTNTKFKNGKPRKTTYFPSYSAYKKSQGMSGKLNLWLTGNFRRGFLTKNFPVLAASGDLRFNIAVRATKNNPGGKLQGLMVDKYPHAFRFTKDERRFVDQKLSALFLKIMSGG